MSKYKKHDQKNEMARAQRAEEKCIGGGRGPPFSALPSQLLHSPRSPEKAVVPLAFPLFLSTPFVLFSFAVKKKERNLSDAERTPPSPSLPAPLSIPQHFLRVQPVHSPVAASLPPPFTY